MQRRRHRSRNCKPRRLVAHRIGAVLASRSDRISTRMAASGNAGAMRREPCLEQSSSLGPHLSCCGMVGFGSSVRPCQLSHPNLPVQRLKVWLVWAVASLMCLLFGCVSALSAPIVFPIVHRILALSSFRSSLPILHLGQKAQYMTQNPRTEIGHPSCCLHHADNLMSCYF